MNQKHFNLADMFEMAAEVIPDREAVVCGDRRVTFKELDEGATQLAHYLQSQGYGKDDHIGLYMYNCIEYIEAMFACFKIRAVPINVNYRYVKDELLYIFDNADMKAVVLHREFVPCVEELQKNHVDVFDQKLKTLLVVDDGFDHDISTIGAVNYEQAKQGQSTELDFEERSADDLFILYTGGTTGMPKGVMWPHEALFFAALNGVGHFHEDGPLKTPEEVKRCKDTGALRGIPLAPMMHGASWWYACIQLLAGNTTVLNPGRSFDATEIWKIIADEKVNSIQIVGDAMAIPLLDELDAIKDSLDLSNLFHVGSGGAVFSESKQAKFKEHFPNVFVINAFGSSESGQMGMDSGEKKSDSGLANVARSDFMDVLVEKEDGSYRYAEKGEMGIFSRSGYIPVGYYNDPVKTDATFIMVEDKRWLLTGDEAKLEDDLSITVYGRGSNCINSGGEKIFPEEVEQALKAHADIFDALVVAVPSERWGEQVAAVVSVRADAILEMKQVQEQLRTLISGFKVPREIYVADEIKRAPSGKPDYKWALAYAESKQGQL